MKYTFIAPPPLGDVWIVSQDNTRLAQHIGGCICITREAGLITSVALVHPTRIVLTLHDAIQMLITAQTSIEDDCIGASIGCRAYLNGLSDAIDYLEATGERFKEVPTTGDPMVDDASASLPAPTVTT